MVIYKIFTKSLIYYYAQKNKQDLVLYLMESNNTALVINRLSMINEGFPCIVDIKDLRSLGYYLETPVSLKPFYILV